VRPLAARSGGSAGGERPAPNGVSDRRRELWSWQRRAALGDLSAGLAHDFNNLLTSIRASCDLLLSDLDSRDPRREDVAAIARTAEQATTLARQLMTLGSQRPLEIGPVDLNAIVSGLEPILLRMSNGRTQIVTTLDPDAGRVIGDAALVEHILLALAINGRDSMPAGGRLELATACRRLEEPLAHRHGVVAAGEYGLLVVRDEGACMDDDTLAGIFDPFTATRARGTAAGPVLASVYGAVAQAEGIIVVTSAAGAGTAFEVYFRRSVRDG
jgi:signal transduction histidine kinase